jgi:hypothetical protein
VSLGSESAGNVIGNNNRFCQASFISHGVTGLRKAHAIAPIVTQHTQDAGTTIGSSDRLGADIDWGTCKNVANCACIEHALADIPSKHRQVSEATTGDHTHSTRRRIGVAGDDSQ